MNVVSLLGRLTADPQMSYKGDMAITKFSLAVDKEGKEGANFIRITCFGKTAENVEKYLKKGSQTAIRGRIETGSYEGKNGRVYTTEVVADRVYFVGSKNKEEFEGFTQSYEDIPF